MEMNEKTRWANGGIPGVSVIFEASGSATLPKIFY